MRLCCEILYLWPVEATTISPPTGHVTAFISLRVVEPLVAV